MSQNKVKIVGAGPGNPELLTVISYKTIINADVIIADKLVSKDILNLAKKSCKIYIANKKGRAQQGQKEIFDIIFCELKKGNDIIRLKVGDPTIYSRILEEISEITQKGYEVEVFPGLSSLNATIAAGIPLTSRKVSDKINISTSHGFDDSYPNIHEYLENTTYIFFMSVSRIKFLVECLNKKGYPLDIPILIIENATLKTQKVLRTKLCDILLKFKCNKILSPALIIIGEITNCKLKYVFNTKNASTIFKIT